MTRQLVDGAAAVADGHGPGRLSVLRRLPDDAVHRGPRTHGPGVASGGGRVHQRRERAGSHRHGLGRGRGRSPFGDRIDRPGSVPDAGVDRRGVHGRHRIRRAQHGAGPGRLLPGDAGRGPRRLPHARPGAVEPGRGGRVWSPMRSTWPTAGATPSSSSATTTSPTPGSTSSSTEPLPMPPAGPDWSLDGTTGGSGRAKLVSPLGTTKQRDGVGYDLAEHYAGCAERRREMEAGIAPRVEVDRVGDADIVLVAYGTMARYARSGRRGPPDRGSPGRPRPAGHPLAVPRPTTSQQRRTGPASSPSTRTTPAR